MFVCMQNQHALLEHFLIIPDKQLDASPLYHQIMLVTFDHLALCILHSMVPIDEKLIKISCKICLIIYILRKDIDKGVNNNN